MTLERVPTRADLRNSYVSAQSMRRETFEQHYLGAPIPDYGAEFDRWLAEHDRAVRAEVAAEVTALAAPYEHEDRPNDHPTACIYEVLTDAAARIEEGDN